MQLLGMLICYGSILVSPDRVSLTSLFVIMKQTRSKFKYALIVCKGNKNSIISDKIAEAMCAKNDRAFWREIKNSSYSKIKLPNVVGNAQGSDNIYKWNVARALQPYF